MLYYLQVEVTMNQVKQLMKTRGMNVTALMRASELSWPTCDGIYKARNWPTDSTQWGTIKAIANALGVSPEYLLSGNNK